MKRIRTLIFIILLVVFLVVCLSMAADYKYVGSSKSNKYHYPTCEWALKINSANLVKFKSAKEALDKGFVPCKVCKPPTKD
jgi:methylphosphotriester-DNA--protein-cysteine methyltransferase